MSGHVYLRREAERLVPLLRSITREIQARARATEEIRRSLDLAAPRDRGRAPAPACLEAQLATHLREMRSAEQELERLGCRLDDQHPERILIPSPSGAWAFEDRLGDTRFYAARTGGAP